MRSLKERKITMRSERKRTWCPTLKNWNILFIAYNWTCSASIQITLPLVFRIRGRLKCYFGFCQNEKKFFQNAKFSLTFVISLQFSIWKIISFYGETFVCYYGKISKMFIFAIHFLLLWDISMNSKMKVFTTDIRHFEL